MIRVIKPSKWTTVWYRDPGVPPDGTGLSFASPILWQTHSSNEGVRCSFTAPDYGSRVYILTKLTEGVTYTLTIGNQTGPTLYDLFAADDTAEATVLKSMDGSATQTYTFSVTTTGQYMLRAANFYSSGSTEYCDISQAPDIITGVASWKMDATRVRPGKCDKNNILTRYSSTTLAEVAHRLFPAIPEEGLWGYWPLTDSSRDVSGNDRDMTTVGVPAFSEQTGMSNITVDNYIKLPVFVYGTTSRSFSMWIDNTGTKVGVLFNYGEDNYGKNLGFTVTNRNKLHGDIYGWSDDTAVIPTPAGLHHIVVTYINTPELCVYADGVKIGTFSAGTTTTADVPLYFGVWHGIFATASTPFGGSISDIALYNRALSAAEVAAIYAAGNTLKK